MSSSNIPLTIQSGQEGADSNIVIGKKVLNLPASQNYNTYWFVIIDRKTLAVAAKFTTTNNSTLPPELKPYLGKTEYIMIVCCTSLYSGNLPQGSLYDFLKSEGAGVQLERGEQVFAALDCSAWQQTSYSLVAVLGNDGGESFELLGLSKFSADTVMTIQLQPFEINGATYYTPVSL